MKSMILHFLAFLLILQFMCYGFYRMTFELPSALLQTISRFMCFLTGGMFLIVFLLFIGNVIDFIRTEGLKDHIGKSKNKDIDEKL